jgi:hypothetical protein
MTLCSCKLHIIITLRGVGVQINNFKGKFS